MPSQSLYGEMFDNGYQVLINSTSLSDYLRCPKYYEYVHIQGWRSDEGKSRHLLFGGWFAEAMQTFYLSRLAGHSRSESIRECVRNAMMDTWEHELDENGDRIPGTGQAWDSLDTKKNRANLIRSIIWYFEHYETDFPVYIMPSGFPAVELQFRIEANPNVFLVGTIDRVVEYFPGDTYLMDQKTTGSAINTRWAEQWDINTQFSFYTFGGRMILPTPARGFIVDGISLAVGSTDFGRALTYRSDAYLDEWFATTLDTISDMHRDTERKRFRMNPGACSSYEGCAFRKICARAPSQRENFLRADFHKQGDVQ